MTINKHFNNVLHLLKEPFSVLELAEAECLPPVLQTSNIALLMHSDSKKIQQAFEIVLNGLINNDVLPAITLEKYINLTIAHERQRDATSFIDPPLPNQLPQITAIAVGHQDTDLLPGNAELNLKQRRMFLVKRDDFKKWLETEGEWPLPRENLLSRWWPDVYYNDNSLSSDGKSLKHLMADEDACQTTNSDFVNMEYAENIFRREGEMWTISYDSATNHYQHSKGFLYISYLIGSPCQEYHVNEILKAAENPEIEVLSFSSGEVTTNKTLDNYRKKLSDIRKEMAEAERTSDELVKKELQEEKESIEKEIKRALGFGGKIKKSPNETTRNAKAVSQAITRCIKKIKKYNPTLAQHLLNAIHCGEYLSYNPDSKISWITTK